jgi:hypothetical protein
MKSFLKVLLSAVASSCLAGCATIVEGTSQNIAVATSPPGSYCALHRDGKTIATLSQTPGEVTVDKTKDDILLTCAASGYEPASQYLHSGIAIGVYGNIIAGGLTGWGVDSMTGADNEYPTTISLNMRPLPGDASVAPTQLPPSPCTKEQSDLRLLAHQQGYRSAENCY